MAIQNRRGVYSDFTPTKMVPGEFAVVNSGDPNSTSGKGVYMSFTDGQAKRLVMEEDVQNEVAKATEDIAQELTQEVEAAIADDVQAAQTAATNASTSAQTATTKASEAAASATQAAQTVANIIDNTLTQTGKAADAKVTGDELEGLKEDLSGISNGVTFHPTTAGSKRFDYQFTAGTAYLFENNGTIKCSLSTDDGTSTVEFIGSVEPGNTISFVASQNASKLKCYLGTADSNGSISVFTGQIAVVDLHAKEASDIVNGIAKKVDGFKIPSPVGSTSVDFSVEQGKTYYFNISSCTVDNNVVVSPYVSGDTYITIEASSDLKRYKFVAPKSGKLLFQNNGAVIDGIIYEQSRFDIDIENAHADIENVNAQYTVVREDLSDLGDRKVFHPTSAGSKTFDYGFTAGTSYILENNGAINCSLSTYDGSSAVESLGTVEPSNAISFTASQNASKLRCYLGSADSNGSISVYKGQFAKYVVKEEEKQDETIRVYLYGTFTGITSIQKPLKLPEGDYFIQIDSIVSNDTDDCVSNIMFTDNSNTNKLSVPFFRNKPQFRFVHIPSGVTRVFLFASKNNTKSQNDNFTYTNVAIIRINKYLFKQEIPTPEGFSWTDHPLVGHLFRTEMGIECDLDVADYKPASGKTYFVSPNGSDSNSGVDSSHPLQSIRTAMLKSDVDIVVIMDGFYDVSLAPQHIDGLARSVAVVAAENAHPVISSNGGSHTFTKSDGYTYLYETTVNSNCIWDIANAIPYTRKATLEEAESAEASYYCDGTTTYVHTKDGNAPASDIRCCPAVDNFRITTSGGISVYIEGLTICGGNDGAFRVTCDGTTRPLVYGKNCLFVGSVEYGACYLEGCESIMQSCEACECTSDGFGIHRNNATHTVSPLAIEIDCDGHDNGIAGDLNNDNGSTLHAAGKAIRVNGRYHHNKGPNVADVHAGTESWNLGCHAWASTSKASDTFDFEILTGKVKMWLDNCSAYGSKQSLYVGDNTEAYVRGCAFVTMSINGSGHLESY